MTMKRKILGEKGEDIALKRLKSIGYEILEKNYRCPFGELDIIARDDDYIVFIEIKTRKNRSTAYAKEAITPKKKKRLYQCALYYMKNHELMENRARFDVVAINMNNDKMDFEIIQNAFDIENFY